MRLDPNVVAVLVQQPIRVRFGAATPSINRNGSASASEIGWLSRSRCTTSNMRQK